MATEASTTESPTAGHNGQRPAALAGGNRRSSVEQSDAALIPADICGYPIDSSLSKGTGLPQDTPRAAFTPTSVSG
jgi:hypothetical protein